MALLAKVSNGPGYLVWCPACEMLHHFDDRWTFNGDMEKPTFSPSMLVSMNWTVQGEVDGEGNVRQNRRCHSFIRNGVWEFLRDCTHAMAGTNVPLVDRTYYE